MYPMAEATTLGAGTTRVADGQVSVVLYDRVSVDHIFQSLWRGEIRARKARVEPATTAVSLDLRDHVVHAS
jgi:hypothetical protein